MAYSDDVVKAKLSSLNETQESIVTVAQWIMFHRRHANRTADLWHTRLQDSSTAKRLNLIYLANEVVQQSRARNKTDFLYAFEPLIGDATALAYKGASQEVQGKLKRVVEVWRQRNIFDLRIQEATERRLEEIEKARGGGANGMRSGSGKKLGGSLFGGSGGNVPVELEATAKFQGALSKAEVGVKPAVDKANEEYAKMTDPDTPIPTAPLHAAKLSALMKHLAAAEGAVEASITARNELLAELDKLVASNRAKLAEDETTAKELVSRKESTEAKKQEIEDNIMRGLSTPTSPENATTPEGNTSANANGGGLRDNKNRSSSKEIERPEAEGFTPPPPDVETFTPPPGQEPYGDTEAGAPVEIAEDPSTAAIFDHFSTDAATANYTSFTSTTGAEALHETPPQLTEPAPAFEPPPALTSPVDPAAAAANEFLSNLNLTQKSARRSETEMSTAEAVAGVNGRASSPGDPRLKRRKLSHRAEEEMDEGILGEGGVDEEGVSALLDGR